MEICCSVFNHTKATDYGRWMEFNGNQWFGNILLVFKQKRGAAAFNNIIEVWSFQSLNLLLLCVDNMKYHVDILLEIYPLKIPRIVQ